MKRWRLSARPRLVPKPRSIRRPLGLERLEDRVVPSVDVLSKVSGMSLNGTASGSAPLAPVAATAAAPAVAQTFHTISAHYGPGQSPGGYWPSQVRHAYGFDQLSLDGSGQTIAIVDAYADPNLSSDLAAFDRQFGLAAPPSFLQVSQTGGSISGVPTDPTGGWEVEESLDVEWAHAIAPNANILLVDANSADLSDLMTAVSYATSQANVDVVSMSWGGSEFVGQSSYDSYFTTPAGHKGITFVAASGDYGAPAGWPATSPNVLAVGGTTLGLNASDNRTSETGWSGSGGGYSAVYGTPSYQQTYAQSSYVLNTLKNQVLQAGSRGNPDVSYDADPSPGYAVYDTFPYEGTSYTWFAVGGTSAGSPQWAALIALADQQRGSSGSLDGPSQTLPELYKLAANATSYPHDFYDITSGNNGYSAQAGYDLVTGLGSPQANNLIPDLAGTASAPTTPTIISSTPTGTVSGPVSAITFTFNESMNASSFALSDVTSFTGPGGSITPTGSSWLDNNTELQVNFSSQSTPGTYSMTLGPNISDPSGHKLSQSYTDTFTIQSATPTTPVIVSSSPTGTVSGPVSAITFTFNESMNPSSFALSDVEHFGSTNNSNLLGDLTGYSWLNNNTELQVDFTPQSAAGTYGMMLGPNISDPSGHKLAQAYTTTFNIQPPVTPVIVSSTPTGTVSGPVSAITFTFNESMNASSFALSDVTSFTGPGGSITPTGSSWLNNNTELQVDFAPQSAAGTYSMTLGPNISDPSGNKLAQAYTTSFTIQAAQGGSQTFTSHDVPAPILGGYMTISTLNVPTNLTISQLTAQLNISYPYTGDLEIDLISPNGTDVGLSYFEGSGANFQNTVFSDTATTPVDLGNSPFAGSYRPETPLSALNGQNAAGTWYLVVQDWGYSSGTINSWSITIQGSGGGTPSGTGPSSSGGTVGLGQSGATPPTTPPSKPTQPTTTVSATPSSPPAPLTVQQKYTDTVFLALDELSLMLDQFLVHAEKQLGMNTASLEAAITALTAAIQANPLAGTSLEQDLLALRG